MRDAWKCEALAAGLLVLCGCARTSRIAVREEPVGSEVVGADAVLVSWDGRHAVVNGHDGVSLDGKTLGRCPTLAREDIVLSDAGGKVAYPAGGTMVVNGAEIAHYQRLYSGDFSPDGKRFAFTASNGRQNFAVIDGNPGPLFDSVTTPVFSPEGGHVAYAGRSGQGIVLVVDGVAAPACRGAGSTSLEDIKFGPGGRRLSYVCNHGDRRAFVVDGVEGPADANAGPAVSHSADGRRYGYMAKRKDDWAVYIDGQMVASGYSGLGAVIFSPDGRRAAWVAVKGGKVHAAIDGVESPAYEQFGESDVASALGGEDHTIRFSADGAHYAYAAKRGIRWFVVKDGAEGRAYDSIGRAGPVFAAGGRIAYTAASGGKAVLVDDGAEQPLAGCEHAGDQMAFSGDSKHLAFDCRVGSLVSVWADGRQIGKQYAEVRDLAFGPGGQAVAFAGKRGEKWVAVVDGFETPEYGRFLCGTRAVLTLRGSGQGILGGGLTLYRSAPLLHFEDGRTVAFFATRGKGLVRVTARAVNFFGR